MISIPISRARVAVAALCVLLLATPTSAQYFGRNKVRYKNFDFQVLKTEHFDIYYYPAEQDGVELAARMAERWYARLERMLDHQLRGRQPLVLYASHTDFEETNAIYGDLSEGTGGVTEPVKRRIILPMGGPMSDTDHVIGHELVHAFQFDITAPMNAPAGTNGAERLPLWFIEGMAEYLSLGPVDPNTTMWLRDALRREKLPSVEQLNDPKYFPYRWGQAFWAYVGGRWGDEVIPRILRSAAATSDPNAAIERVLGIKTKQLSSDWHAAIQRDYESVFASAETPNETGRVVIKSGKLDDLNVGPAISPDGKWIAFLSARSLFSIDLYIADASTGHVAHRLTSTASDPHYSSIQFIYSAGAWDASSQRIAIATVTGGRPALAVFNAQKGTREREVRIPDVDEIFNPTWSPDGQSICFTAMVRGVTDLYIVELASGHTRALTHDAFADVQPAWSPDGTRIAFATDRFTSTLDVLQFGELGLALVDVGTGSITPVRTFATGKAMNPQWTADSRSLSFIADPDGMPNLYRVALDGGALTRVTHVVTGLSGITRTSPALSAATAAGTVAFSVYDDGKYDIYVRPADRQEGIPADAGQAGVIPHAAILPPVDRKMGQVARLLADARFGLPAPQPYESDAYKARLGVQSIGTPTVGVGFSQFGTQVGGGLSAYFSDMLGDHSLGVGFQVNSGFNGNFSAKDIAAQAQYLNQAHRWNWGLIGGQVPYVSGGVQEAIGNVTGGTTPQLIDQISVFRQTEQSIGGLVAYPLNRAQRLEFQGGVTHYSFDQEIRTQVFDLHSGALLLDTTAKSSVADPLTLGTSAAALVSDTTNFGATSPVQGQRYRLEASPTFGSINYTTLLADYRKYVMPFPFYTVALRGLHYGRYGSGGEDPRLYPLYLGYPDLVRGYDPNSFTAAECSFGETCATIDRLTGSRMLVGNAEFRFPLLRPFVGTSRNMYGPVPVEVGIFADAGVAWNRGEKPSFFGGNRDGVSSTGVVLRANLFGVFIGEFDFVRPLQRPGRGWVFQFNLASGF